MFFSIRFWTNLDASKHAVSLSAAAPVILYAEVMLGPAPIIDASVIAEIQVRLRNIPEVLFHVYSIHSLYKCKRLLIHSVKFVILLN